MKNPFKPKVIGTGYMHRWHIIPRNPFFNIYLHKFIGDDDDRALHDHPWWSLSIRLKGQLLEYIDHRTYKPYLNMIYINKKWLRTFIPPRIYFRSAEYAHRLELIDKTKPAWTIFITGPRKREWGFHCPNGWQHWSTMTTKDGKTIGGCE